MNDYKFGNFIYTLRTEKGMTQQDLAKALGVTPAAVSKWENGSSKPRYEMLLKLAEILDVSSEELINGEKTDEQPVPEVSDNPPKKRPSVFKIVGITVLVLVLIFCASIIIKPDKPPEQTKSINSNVNSNNQSYCMVAKHGDWIYYCDPYSPEDYLYKMRTDKSEKQRLVKDWAAAISVTEDWVYYSKETIKDGYAGVYRIKHDGTQKELLASGKFWYIYATDEWVYYADGTPYIGGTLFRMKPDGTQSEQVSNQRCKSISINGDWIYYTLWQAPFAYKMRLDGTENTRLEPVRTIRNIVVEDDTLYTYDGNLLRIKQLDGPGYKQYVQRGIEQFNVSDGCIYFVKNQTGQATFYKINSDLSGYTELFTMNGSFTNEYMCVIDDWLYFSRRDKKDRMYRVKTDGSGEVELVS